MSNPDPLATRLSDSERDAAVEALRVHFEAGRLRSDEFDERMAAALTARTAADSVSLFADLPEPHPSFLAPASPSWSPYPTGASVPEPGSPTARPSTALTPTQEAGLPLSTSERWVGALHAVIWPVVLLWVFVGDGPFWLIFVAMVLSSAVGGYQGNRRRNRRQPPPY